MKLHSSGHKTVNEHLIPSSPVLHACLVRDFLEKSAERLPGKTALVCDGRRLTYSQLDEMANRMAHSLIRMGVVRGDRVALYLQNSVEAVTAIFGVLKLGAVFVAINPMTKHRKLDFVLNNCRAAALISDARGDLSRLTDARDPAVPSLKGMILCGRDAGDAAKGESCVGFDEAIGLSSADRPARQGTGLDLACLIYTSGSTGDPKGVMSDNNNIDFATSSIIEVLGNTEKDIVISFLPLSFDYGLYQLLMVFKFGGTLVLEKSFAYPAAILKRMEEERVTGLPGVPTVFSLLLPMDLSSFDLSNLRYLTNTAAALSANHIEEIRRKFPQSVLHSMYGLTETKRTLHLPPAELNRRPGSVGVPIPGTAAWLEDESGRPVGAGQIGELVVRGGHVMRGYWESPEATARRFRPGAIPGERLCFTGDLFRQDEEGFFYFVGRKDDIIKSRGEKVAPKEVESALYALPGVNEVAVIGVPDDVLGQAIKAFVVAADDSLDERRVLLHCRANLEDFMVPKHVEFRSSLPRTPSGKITTKGLK